MYCRRSTTSLFKRIESANPCNPGYQHCLTAHHWCTVYSSADGHGRIRLEYDNSSIYAAKLNSPRLTCERIIKQILLGIDYLHRECGYVRTDVRADNVLAALPDPIVPQIESTSKATNRPRTTSLNNHLPTSSSRSLLSASTLTCVISWFNLLTTVKPLLLTSWMSRSFYPAVTAISFLITLLYQVFEFPPFLPTGPLFCSCPPAEYG